MLTDYSNWEKEGLRASSKNQEISAEWGFSQCPGEVTARHRTLVRLSAKSSQPRSKLPDWNENQHQAGVTMQREGLCV